MDTIHPALMQSRYVLQMYKILVNYIHGVTVRVAPILLPPLVTHKCILEEDWHVLVMFSLEPPSPPRFSNPLDP